MSLDPGVSSGEGRDGCPEQPWTLDGPEPAHRATHAHVESGASTCCWAGGRACLHSALLVDAIPAPPIHCDVSLACAFTTKLRRGRRSAADVRALPARMQASAKRQTAGQARTPSASDLLDSPLAAVIATPSLCQCGDPLSSFSACELVCTPSPELTAPAVLGSAWIACSVPAPRPSLHIHHITTRHSKPFRRLVNTLPVSR